MTRRGAWYSMQRLAWAVGMPLDQLRALAINAECHYDPFSRKQPGKADRTIDNPDEPLKDVGRRVRRVFLAPIPLDKSVQGCVK